MMLSLAELQASFQRAVIDGDESVLGLFKAPPRDSRNVRLGVYRHAYSARLVEFIENDFEKLRLFMGPERFTQMARDYAASHTSDHPNARWYSRHLPEFLATDDRYGQSTALGDLAALELAINDAFDAEDAESFTLNDLSSVPVENFASASFAASPSLRRLATGTNVGELWPLLDADMTDVPAVQRLEQPAELLVWRQDLSSHFRELTAEEAMAVDAMREGVPFGVLCEMIAFMDDPDTAATRAANYLRNWIDGGLIAGITQT